MKTLKTPIILFLILIIFSFKSFDEEVEKCFIKMGETLTFSNKPTSGSYILFEGNSCTLK